MIIDYLSLLITTSATFHSVRHQRGQLNSTRKLYTEISLAHWCPTGKWFPRGPVLQRDSATRRSCPRRIKRFKLAVLRSQREHRRLSRSLKNLVTKFSRDRRVAYTTRKSREKSTSNERTGHDTLASPSRGDPRSVSSLNMRLNRGESPLPETRSRK